MITTTLERIQPHKPNPGRWREFLACFGKTEADDEPLPFARIVEICGLKDALWCCHAEPQYAREWSLFAVWCARQVQHLMTDPRSIAALDVAERYARGEATYEELGGARADARGAFHDADGCAAAGWFATLAAYDAVYSAAWRLPSSYGWYAGGVAHAAVNAAITAATAERAAAAAQVARAVQTEEFLRVVNETEARA